jgi:hypothetical protein
MLSTEQNGGCVPQPSEYSGKEKSLIPHGIQNPDSLVRRLITVPHAISSLHTVYDKNKLQLRRQKRCAMCSSRSYQLFPN